MKIYPSKERVSAYGLCWLGALSTHYNYYYYRRLKASTPVHYNASKAKQFYDSPQHKQKHLRPTMQSCSLPNSISINIFINCADFSIMHHEPDCHIYICCQNLHHQQNHLRQQCKLLLLYHESHHYIFGKNNNSISTTIIKCADFSIIHHELLHHVRCQHLQHQRNHLHQRGRLLMYHKFHRYTAGKNNDSKNIFTTAQPSLSCVMNLTAKQWKLLRLAS